MLIIEMVVVGHRYEASACVADFLCWSATELKNKRERGVEKSHANTFALPYGAQI